MGVYMPVSVSAIEVLSVISPTQMFVSGTALIDFACFMFFKFL